MKTMFLRSLLPLCCALLLNSTANAAYVPTEKEKLPAATNSIAPTTEQATAEEEANLLYSAENALKGMSRSELRAKAKEVRKAFREWRREHRDGKETTTSLVLLIILAILIPPLAVGLYERRLSSKFWISLLLTILFFIPGMVYSLLVVTGVV